MWTVYYHYTHFLYGNTEAQGRLKIMSELVKTVWMLSRKLA